LALTGSGVTIDLIALANNRVAGIEKINLAGSGNNTLTLTLGDLLELSDTSNQLIVDGNAGDVVNAGSGWTDGGVAGGYHSYTQGAAILLVDTDITQNVTA
jgi:hypothetical protein